MKLQNILIFFLILLLSANASNIESDTYGVDSYHLGLSESDYGNDDYSYQTTSTYQQSFSEFASNAIYTLVTGWSNVVEEIAETISVVSSNRNKITATTNETCTNDWQCTNWFPAECTSEGKQERACINHGTCGGKKTEKQICKYTGPTEPLFDIFLTIYKNYKELAPRSAIKANVIVKNMGKEELLDAFMTYWIVDSNNQKIAELRDSRAITNNLDYDIELTIPTTAQTGMHSLYSQITYSVNKTAIASESFNIVEKPSTRIPSYQISYVIIATVIIAMLLIALITYLIKKGKKSENSELIGQLTEYIKTEAAKGHSHENIREHIIMHGHKAEDIDKAINIINQDKNKEIKTS